MLRRLLLGLIKGILLGGAIGAALHFGAHVPVITTWLNYLLYGGVALLAGVIAGKPPWREGAWVESILKAIVGFGIGAGAYALAHYFLKFPVGGLLREIPADTRLAHIPLFFAPVVATIYATLIELDNSGGDESDEGKTGVRVKAGGDAGALEDEVPASRGGSEARPSARNKR